MLLISSSIPPPSFGNRWTQDGIKRLTVNPLSIPQRCWDEKENSLWLELWIQLQPPSLICCTSSLQLLNHMNQTCDPQANYVHQSLDFEHGGYRNWPSDLCNPRPVSTFRSRTALFTRLSKKKKTKEAKVVICGMFFYLILQISKLQMLMWNNTKYFTHWTESRPEILFLRLLMFQRDEYLGGKKLKSPWRKVMGVSSDVLHKSLLNRSTVFFPFFQPEGHFFPLPTSLWHIPMRKSRHHKAARTEMEKDRNVEQEQHAGIHVLCGRVRRKKAEFIIGIILLFFFLHVSARWPFSKCRHIRESASKNGGKKYWGFLIDLKQKVIERKKKMRSGEAQVMEGLFLEWGSKSSMFSVESQNILSLPPGEHRPFQGQIKNTLLTVYPGSWTC